MKINRNIKNIILHEIRSYHENKRMLEEYKQDIIDSSPPPPDGMPGARITTNPTEGKILKMESCVYIRRTEQVIRAIDHALSQVDSLHREVIDLMFWRRTHTATGAALKLNASQATIYRWIDDVIVLVGKELGYL